MATSLAAVGSVLVDTGRIGRVALGIYKATDGKPWTFDGKVRRWLAIAKCQGDDDTPGLAVFFGKRMAIAFWMTQQEHRSVR